MLFSIPSPHTGVVHLGPLQLHMYGLTLLVAILACMWLTGDDGIGPDEETRTALALRIIECARNGERDPEKVKAYALAGLSAIVVDSEKPTSKP